MASKVIKSTLFSRREVVVSSALAALLGPVLRAREAQGAALTAPRRIILLFSPNGPMMATGPASGTETAFSIHPWWQPLERHKAEAIFLSNLSSSGAGVVPGPQKTTLHRATASGSRASAGEV